MSSEPLVGSPRAFSPGLEWLAVGNDWRELALMNVESGRVTRTGLTLGGGAAWVSPDQLLAVVALVRGDGVLALLQLDDGGTVPRRRLIDGQALSAMALGDAWPW